MMRMCPGRRALLLGSVLWWMGCEPADASWRLTEPLEGAVAPVEVSGEDVAVVAADDRFPSDEEIAHMEDPLGEAPAENEEETSAEEGAGQTPPGSDEALEPSAETAAETAVETTVETAVETAVKTTVGAESLTADEVPAGLPKGPGWGVRLVATLPAAQPPRAVLGLPTGIEVVVSPGSMVPEVGVVVIAVGQGTVDLALVTPEGDHARVEQRTLHAQYQGPEGSE
jgi:hypothetical protein